MHFHRKINGFSPKSKEICKYLQVSGNIFQYTGIDIYEFSDIWKYLY